VSQLKEAQSKLEIVQIKLSEMIIDKELYVIVVVSDLSAAQTVGLKRI